MKKFKSMKKRIKNGSTNIWHEISHEFTFFHGNRKPVNKKEEEMGCCPIWLEISQVRSIFTMKTGCQSITS